MNTLIRNNPDDEPDPEEPDGDRLAIGIDLFEHVQPIVVTDYGNAQPASAVDYAEIRRQMESPEGYNGLRVWSLAPRLRPRPGLTLDGVFYNEPVARFLFRLGDITAPEHDEYGLPRPQAAVLFWDWPHRRPPVSEHPSCSRPLRTMPGSDASLFEKLDHSIRWSREQLRQGSPSLLTMRWDQISDRLPDVWQLRAGMRARMPDEVADAVNDITEQRWRSLYEGQFLTPQPGPTEAEAEAQWRSDRRHAGSRPDSWLYQYPPTRYGW